MGDLFYTRLSSNVSNYKNSLEQIIEKYSKLQYQDGGVEVDLHCTTLGKLEHYMELSKAEISKLESKSLADLREESIRATDVTRDSQLDFTYEDGGADETCVSSTQSSAEADATSANNSTALTATSSDESSRNISVAEVQPEDRDQDLEMSLRSHGSSLVELYPGMIGRIGRVWRRRHVFEAAGSVLRRYRRWRRRSGRGALGNTFVVALRNPENDTSQTPSEEEEEEQEEEEEEQEQEEEEETRNSPVKRQFTGAEADPRSPLKMVNHVQQQQSPLRTRINVQQHSPFRMENHVQQHSPFRMENHVQQQSPWRTENHVQQQSPLKTRVNVQQQSPWTTENHVQQQQSPLKTRNDVQQQSPWRTENHVQQQSPRRTENHVQQQSPWRTENHVQQQSPWRTENHVQQQSPRRTENHVQQQSPRRTENHVQQQSPWRTENHVQQQSPWRMENHVQQQSPWRTENHVQQQSPCRTRWQQHQPVLVMDFSGRSETVTPGERSLNETFTVSGASRRLGEPGRSVSPSRLCRPADPSYGSGRLSLPRSLQASDLRPAAYASETGEEEPDDGGVYGSPARQSPSHARRRRMMMTMMETGLSGSPHGFPRSPKAHPGDRFPREPSRPRLSSAPPPHKPAVPLRRLRPQDARHSLHPQLRSPQSSPAAAAAAAASGRRHGLRRHLSFDSSLTSTRASDSPKKLDEDFLQLYHKFVCQSKSSFFNRHPCRLCARSSDAGGGSSPFSSSLAALALSPHRSLLRKRHRELLDRDGLHPRSKRQRDERCPSSPGSRRHGEEMLRRRLSPPAEVGEFQRLGPRRSAADAHREAWTGRRGNAPAADCPGTMGSLLESRRFSPRKW